MPELRWGGLMDHWSDCLDHYDDDDDDCTNCEDGKIRWGSFYADAGTAPCDDCGTEIELGCMYAPGCIEYVCLSCYLKHHARDCGCVLWPATRPMNSREMVKRMIGEAALPVLFIAFSIAFACIVTIEGC